MPKVIADSRERNRELVAALEGRGIEVGFETLPCGDYLISDRVCVERKTVQDFESSLVDGRLFDQLERMREAFEIPIMIIEGDRELFRFQRNVITGTIVSIVVDKGVGVLFADDEIETARILEHMAKHESELGSREPSLKGGMRALTDAQFQEFVIANLPGIGPKLARALLGHFGSVRAVTNASLEELEEVEGIGPKKAGRVHAVINRLYRTVKG